MLKELHIQNFAIIDKADLFFDSGINIITGETGAGKSLLIDAVRVLLGDRALSDFIKKKCDNAYLTAVFENLNPEINQLCEKFSIPCSDEIIIRRIISKKNSTKNYVNDIPVTVNVLKSITDFLVEMHGQFENQKLFSVKEQLCYIDGYNSDSKLKKQFNEKFEEVSKIKNQIKELNSLYQISDTEIEWKKYQIEELNNINLNETEYNDLFNKIKIAEQSKSIITNFNNLKDSLKDNDLSFETSLYETIKFLDKIKESDDKLNSIFELCKQIDTFNNELYYQVDDYCSELDGSEIDLDNLQKQIFNVQKVLRKHKLNNFNQIIELKNKLQSDLNNIDNAENKINELQVQLKKQNTELIKIAEKISGIRKKNSVELSKKITDKIRNLQMKDAEFKINVEFNPDKLNNTGCDEIRFLIKTNKGADYKNIKDVLSGGELSRIMLALKSVNAENSEIDTIIFDEIDTGISGKTASKIADELFALSKKFQIMCITHQPAIAALNGIHYKIDKKNLKDSTITHTQKLNKKEKVYEIAHLMTGGKVTQTSIKSANELLSSYL